MTTTTTTTNQAEQQPWVFRGIQPEHTTANLTFQVPIDEPTWVSINSKKVGEPESNFTHEDRSMLIHNLRTWKEPVGLDITGFEFKKIPSAFSRDYRNFEDEEAIKREYYPEVVRALKEVTGGKEIFIFDHTIRRRQINVADDDPSKRQPVPRVHIDQTPSAARNRVYRHMGNRAEELLHGRFQLINFWRPIRHAAEDMPLAVASYRSIDPARDLVPTKLIYPDPLPSGETYNVLHHPKQEFFYTKALTPEEVMLIKCFDSDASVAGLTPHTAFKDPNTDPDAPMRQSIEVRCLVFH